MFHSSLNNLFGVDDFRASGCLVFTNDGSLFDFTCGGNGNLILGYASPVVEKCLLNTIQKGILGAKWHNTSSNLYTALNSKLINYIGSDYASVILHSSTAQLWGNINRIIALNAYNKNVTTYDEVIYLTINGNYNKQSFINNKQINIFLNVSTLSDLSMKITQSTCAVVIGKVQLDGSILTTEDITIARDIFSFCNERNILTIFDNSQFSYHKPQIDADIVIFGSDIANGITCCHLMAMCHDVYNALKHTNNLFIVSMDELSIELCMATLNQINSQDIQHNIDHNHILLNTTLNTLLLENEAFFSHIIVEALQARIYLNAKYNNFEFASLLLENNLIVNCTQGMNCIEISLPVNIQTIDLINGLEIFKNTIPQMNIIS